ncbi:hypothetical protein RTBOTA2_004723 [Rhodotorula toruloides]|nr:hypothetical protein RTBOTA2_004723 [Rhodotorula toruloides]
MPLVPPDRMLKLTPHHATHSLLPAIRSFAADAPSSFRPADLRTWYLNPKTDPLHPAILFCTGISVVVWLLGEVTGNVSQVDRLWTTLPLVYSAHFTFWPYWSGQVSHVAQLDHRMLLVFALQCCWSARLTFQSARRGFLDPRSEDYRWPLVRKAIPKPAFKLLNLVFIAFIQNFLLLAAELPQYLLLTHWQSSSGHISTLAKLKPHHASTSTVPLNIADALLAVTFVTTLVFEMRADNQQQTFQRLKHGGLDKQKKGQQITDSEKKAIERGFVAEGLWAWSRHPNFACEQTTWYLLYAFTVLPFLPITQSFASHPISTLRYLLTPSFLLSHTQKLLFTLSDSLPSLDSALTSLQHPLLYLRAHSSHLTNHSFLRSEAAKVHLEALSAWNTIKSDEGHLWNYSIIAPLTMSALFFSSTMLTEQISAKKYPLYKQYQKRVAKFWAPLTPLKGLYLTLSGGRKNRVERQIWGGGLDGGRKIKQI